MPGARRGGGGGTRCTGSSRSRLKWTACRRPPLSMRTGDHRDQVPRSASAGISASGSRRYTKPACKCSASTRPTGPTCRWRRPFPGAGAQANDVFVVAGNVASAEAFRWLEDHGADAIRVGIAGGSVCETRTETAVFVPTPYAVWECAQARRHALVIGDSGVRSPSDFCKLLAFGADAVMLGSALAGTREAPGRVIVVDGNKYKIMRGAASFSVQQEYGGEEPEYVEGAETMVSYKGSVHDVTSRYRAGLRSSMSYMNARTLAEYRTNVNFVFHYSRPGSGDR